MTKRMRIALLAVGAVAVLGLGGAAIAGATGGGEDDDSGDRPISGNALVRASAAALDTTGGGRVTDTEVDDEEGAYEVEVTRSDGSQVDVHLNRDFEVQGTDSDREDGPGGDDRED
jgi:uncharacterized membrane protein YkoI